MKSPTGWGVIVGQNYNSRHTHTVGFKSNIYQNVVAPVRLVIEDVRTQDKKVYFRSASMSGFFTNIKGDPDTVGHPVNMGDPVGVAMGKVVGLRITSIDPQFIITLTKIVKEF